MTVDPSPTIAAPPATLDVVLAELRQLRTELAPVLRLVAQAQQIPRLAKALGRTDI